MNDSTRRWLMLGLAAAVAVVTTLAMEPARSQAPPASSTRQAMAYDEAADPAADLQQALAAARRSGKRVLVVFGANWCPDCRVLDREFHAGGKTEALVKSRYEVVKVDVGRFDRNLDFAKLYGEPIRKGIPSVVIVTPANEVVYQTKAGELADARGLGPDGIHDFFATKAGS